VHPREEKLPYLFHMLFLQEEEQEEEEEENYYPYS
jgi:hypothetical protein